MKIKPSDRPKKRYIAFEVKDDCAINNTIKKSLTTVLGSNYPDAGIKFIKDKYTKHRGIFRVNNRYSKLVVDALNKEGIKTVGMSGILKKAENKYLKVAS